MVGIHVWHAALLLSRCNIMQEENNVILAKVITPLGLAGSDNTVPRRARSKARPSCVAARTFNGGGNPINSLLDRGGVAIGNKQAGQVVEFSHTRLGFSNGCYILGASLP